MTMSSFGFLPYSLSVRNSLTSLEAMLLQWLFYLIPLLISLPHCVHTFGMRLMEISHTDRSQIDCTLALLQKYFQYGEPLSGSIISMSFTSASLHTQQDLLNAMHTQVAVPWTVVVRNTHQVPNNLRSTMILHEKPQCYFIVIENLNDGDLENVFEDWKKSINWNPLAQFVVYLASVEETDDEMTELMIEVLLSFMNKKIYNVNVIGRSEESGLYYGKTVFPYHPDNNCGNRVITIVTLDMCDYQGPNKPKYDYNSDEEDDEEEAYYGGKDDDDDQGDDDGNKRDAHGGENREDNGDRGQNTNGKENDYGNRSVDKEGDGNTDQDADGEVANGAKLNENNNGESSVVENDSSVVGRNESVGEATNSEMFEEEDREYKRIEKYFNYGKQSKGKYKDKDDQEESADVSKSSGEIEGSVIVGDNVDKRADDGNVDVVLEETDNIGDYRGQMEDRGYHYDYMKNELQRNKVGNREGNGEERYKKSDDYVTENEKRTMGWTYEYFDHGKRLNPIQTPTNLIMYTKEKNKQTSDLKVTKRNRNLSRKRSLPKHQKLTYYNQNGTNDLQTQNIHLQELYRASLLDKFPKDLSGCPIVAAFRPWAPYIFKESSKPENKPDKNPKADESSEDLSTEEATNDVANEKNVNESDNDTYYDAEAENAYNDADTADVSGEPAMKLNGIEYQLVQMIGERLHITIDLQLENSNLYLLFQQLIDGDIEMILGGIDEDPSISQFVSSTIAYYQDDLTWCVARAKRKYDLFNFVQSFHISTWLLICALIIISSLNVYLAQKLLNIRLINFDGFFATFLRIIGIILSQSTQLTRLPYSLQIAFGNTFFLAMIFVNIYQSFLVSTLTTPKSFYQISHLEEIYLNRMTVTGSAENVRHLNKDGEIFKYIRENFQMCYNIEECLNRAAADESLVVAVSRLHSFYDPHIKRDQLYCFDRNDNLYVYLVTMLLPKKFHLLPKINPVIQHIIESGHMQKWARELDLKRRLREEIERTQKGLVKNLTIKQVGGSFALLGMLSAVALVIFLLECWTHWMVVKRRTRLRLVKLLHRKFSSR